MGRGPRRLPGGGDPTHGVPMQRSCSLFIFFSQPAKQAKIALTATGQRVGWGHEVGDRPRTPQSDGTLMALSPNGGRESV